MSARLSILMLLALSLGATTALAKPATTLKIVDTTTFETPQDSPWYLRTMLTADVPLVGAQGFGISGGHMGEYVFYDFAGAFYRATYGGVHVFQSGITGADPLAPTSEVGRRRTTADTGSMFTLGAGLGFMFKLFGSDSWVESGRFGLNYMQFQDSTNNLGFRGPMVSFHAEAGYRLSRRTMLAPGITYNLGYVTRTTESAPPVTGPMQHDKFLPLNWWAWEFAFYFFL